MSSGVLCSRGTVLGSQRGVIQVYGACRGPALGQAMQALAGCSHCMSVAAGTTGSPSSTRERARTRLCPTVPLPPDGPQYPQPHNLNRIPHPPWRHPAASTLLPLSILPSPTHPQPLPQTRASAAPRASCLPSSHPVQVSTAAPGVASSEGEDSALPAQCWAGRTHSGGPDSGVCRRCRLDHGPGQSRRWGAGGVLWGVSQPAPPAGGAADGLQGWSLPWATPGGMRSWLLARRKRPSLALPAARAYAPSPPSPPGAFLCHRSRIASPGVTAPASSPRDHLPTDPGGLKASYRSQRRPTVQRGLSLSPSKVAQTHSTTLPGIGIHGTNCALKRSLLFSSLQNCL